MKKLLFLLMTTLAPILIWAGHTEFQDEETTESSTDSCLVVWQKDGSKVFFNMGEPLKIKYVEEKVVIESSTIVEYEFQAIRKMTYDVNVIDGIADAIPNKGKPFMSHDKTVTFLPADKDLHIRIVSINGMVIRDFVVRKNETSSISLDAIPTKIYLINVNGVTYKIYVR